MSQESTAVGEPSSRLSATTPGSTSVKVQHPCGPASVALTSFSCCFVAASLSLCAGFSDLGLKSSRSSCMLVCKKVMGGKEHTFSEPADVASAHRGLARPPHACNPFASHIPLSVLRH